MKRCALFALVFICLSSTLAAQANNPLANPSAMVVAGNVRFTILTPGIIRMEYSADGVFEDHASLTFLNRNLPVPAFTKKEKGGWLLIKTSELTLRYRISSDSFNVSNLFIDYSLSGQKQTWSIGKQNKGNLKGTTRTLDGCKGNITYRGDTLRLENGLISRDGWVVIDDSQRPLFDNSDWPWVMPRPAKKVQDLYFFLYGTNYKKALYDFSLLAGKIALPPKFTFGVWWSRYWEYSDVEMKNLVEEFRLHDVPLDVLVIDMDWHIVNRPEWFNDKGERLDDQAGESCGWTGYTWNRSLFPDPEGFLKWTNENHIQTCMNLHPASGIQPHEDQYTEFAEAMGVDPATKKYVPFDITNKRFAQNYLDIILHPFEKLGIDFWWLDWQQWSTTNIKGVNPTFYLNYVFTSDKERRNIRPLIYHRWGGLGNHRYQIGFSGDTKICWSSLDYQPYFTATASNVLFGFWSHDIGGHMNPDGYDPELYTRWIQWGAFSPVLRTHCTKDPNIERKIWAYPEENFNAMRNAIKLRYSLFPYNYTNARMAYDSAVSIVRPLYYDYPEENNAYSFKNQYMFGPDIMVSPVTNPMKKDAINGDALFVSQKIWLPAGEWYEWCTGTLIKGNQVVDRPYMINEIPLYVRSGAIIPMQPDMKRIGEKAIDPLIINIFPGKSGKTRVYDDASADNGFKNNEYTFTTISFIKRDSTITARIDPIEGKFHGMPESRCYEIRLPLTFVPVSVRVNGKMLDYTTDGIGWFYDGSNLSTIIRTGRFNVNDRTDIEIIFPDMDQHQLSGIIGKANKVFYTSRQIIASSQWNHRIFPFDDVTAAGQTLNRISLHPDNKSIMSEKARLEQQYERIIDAFDMQKSEDPKKMVPLVELLKAGR
ncbi:MAG TPA: glycoside hydrolase family 31 protein [Bacteroidales bacterium]|nr:glycoside hydrolase family 31 protein [Bacteroidales bacterium]HPT12311.1 glycoside hydrolase family 31 protein [Bacteroidales bacterium]